MQEQCKDGEAGRQEGSIYVHYIFAVSLNVPLFPFLLHCIPSQSITFLRISLYSSVFFRVPSYSLFAFAFLRSASINLDYN